MNNVTSPDNSDVGIERLIQAKGKTAPRVTPEDVEANIVSEFYFTGLDGAVQGDEKSPTKIERHIEGVNKQASARAIDLLTFCVLVLKNGFTVTGESACASPENFDAEIGRRIARENAVKKIWPLMGYQLKTELSKGNP